MKKSNNVKVITLEDIDSEEDIANDYVNLMQNLSEIKRDVRLSDESDYFDND